MTKLTKWIPTTNLLALRRLGKLGEELGELTAVVNRCIIQGINEVDPNSNEWNKHRLEKKIADVLAQLSCTVATFGLDSKFIGLRIDDKLSQMATWDAMFDDKILPDEFC